MMVAAAIPTTTRARRVLDIRGVVQGVGFRPYVYRVAVGLGLSGGVWNGAGGVTVDAEGDPVALDRFCAALRAAPPPARVDSVEESPSAPVLGQAAFAIRSSRDEGVASPRVAADLATCPECVAELFDPGDRRYLYPFIACAACGPRYTVIRESPYDRQRTTFDAFPPCASCGDEYDDPASRRFHAQAISCDECGPRLRAEGAPAGGDPIAAAVLALRRGEIVGLMSLGGMHLACDARDAAAVARLRAAKGRADKPFAVMFESAFAIGEACSLDAASRAALEGRERPIVLVPRRGAGALAASVAPGLGEVGAFLPGTGLHHLLLRSFAAPLVMTSGNRTDEPVATSVEEARRRLGSICGVLLLHDREIVGRADDSVVRVTAGAPRLLRRAKGYAPGPFALGFAGPDVLAVGADLKNTLCVTRGTEAFLSPHVGDLEDLDAQMAWQETRARMERLFRTFPVAAAHDLHPGYHGTSIASRSGLPAIPVQHHHAHVASCLVENGFPGRVIGVAWDGTGYGPDGTVWGGEILGADLSGFTRLGRLRPVALAGGDAAVREGWRMAVAHLIDAGVDPARVAARGAASVARMIATGAATVPTSSMGRLFDAVASLCGVRQVSSYEGQAAQELEALVLDGDDPYPLPLDEHGALLEMDARPLVRAVVADVDGGVSPAVIASRFHAGIAAALVASCRAARERTGLQAVALTGGCFANRRLTELAATGLKADGFEVLLHARVPPGDGGIALGQAAVAAWRLAHVPGDSR